MPELPNKPQITNQQSIAEEITTFDMGMRRQLIKNTSQTYIRSPFEAQSQQDQLVSRKTSIKSSWFQCGTIQINDTFRDRMLSCSQALDEKRSSQRRAIKVYSLSNAKKIESVPKRQEKKPKINVSLNKTVEKKNEDDLRPFHPEIKPAQKEVKQNRSVLQQQKIRIDVKLPQKQQSEATKNYKVIKQPDFHYKHPLQGKQRCLNGTYLSRMIAERALQPKTKPFTNYL